MSAEQPATTPADTLEVHHDRKSMGNILLFAAGGIVLCGYFLYKSLFDPEYQGRARMTLVGMLGTPLSVFALIGCAVRLMDRRPALTLTSDALTNRTAVPGAFELPWSEVEAAYVKRHDAHGRTTLYVCVRPRNVAGFLERQSVIVREQMRSNLAKIGAPVCITTSTLDITTERLAEAMQARVPGGAQGQPETDGGQAAR